MRVEDIAVWLLTEKAQVIISGTLGGVVRWLTLRERCTEGLVSVIVGAICAVYLGPLVEPILKPFVQVILTEQISRSSFTGFIVGIGGITFAGFVIDVVRAKRREVARDDEEDRQRERREQVRSNREGPKLDAHVQRHLGNILRAQYENRQAVEPEVGPAEGAAGGVDADH